MLAATPEWVGDTGVWAGAFVALAGALAVAARGMKQAVVAAIHPELREIKGSISQLSADNTAQHVQNANAALERDKAINGRIDGLTDELRTAGTRFEHRIVVVEETIADHIANKVVHVR